MDTLKTLPDLEGRRFGSLALGYDKIDHIRMEFGVLETLAAKLIGCAREEVSIPKVQQLLGQIEGARVALTDDHFATVEGLSTADLLALAVDRVDRKT